MQLLTLVTLAAALAVPAAAAAQATRAEVLERQRAEKATELRPYRPGRLEKIVADAERGRLRRLISPHNGLFATYGYTHRPVGAGISFGGGFRHDLFERQARIELEAGTSFRNYQLLRADFSLLRLAGGRLEVGAEGTYRRHPQEDFYGPGLASLEENRVSYLWRGRELQARAIAKPRPWLHLGTRLGRLSPEVGTGADKRFPSLGEVFDDVAAPGLLTQLDFLYGEGFIGVDTRDEPGNARAGGHYALRWRKYADRELGRYSHDLYEILAQHFVPLFDKKRVFAFQASLIGADAATGHQVPFYMQPTLG